MIHFRNIKWRRKWSDNRICNMMLWMSVWLYYHKTETFKWAPPTRKHPGIHDCIGSRHIWKESGCAPSPVWWYDLQVERTEQTIDTYHGCARTDHRDAMLHALKLEHISVATICLSSSQKTLSPDRYKKNWHHSSHTKVGVTVLS